MKTFTMPVFSSMNNERGVSDLLRSRNSEPLNSKNTCATCKQRFCWMQYHWRFLEVDAIFWVGWMLASLCFGERVESEVIVAYLHCSSLRMKRKLKFKLLKSKSRDTRRCQPNLSCSHVINRDHWMNADFAALAPLLLIRLAASIKDFERSLSKDLDSSWWFIDVRPITSTN